MFTGSNAWGKKPRYVRQSFYVQMNDVHMARTKVVDHRPTLIVFERQSGGFQFHARNYYNVNLVESLVALVFRDCKRESHLCNVFFVACASPP